jgi:hypothetical protein
VGGFLAKLKYSYLFFAKKSDYANFQRNWRRSGWKLQPKPCFGRIVKVIIIFIITLKNKKKQGTWINRIPVPSNIHFSSFSLQVHDGCNQLHKHLILIAFSSNTLKRLVNNISQCTYRPYKKSFNFDERNYKQK